MMFLSVLFLLLSLLYGALAVDSTPTYEHQDPVTGQTLTCAMCPRGQHMAAHCTAVTPTVCVPCKAEHFTELWNYLSRCLYCSNFCGNNQEVETECSPISNRVCRCKEGFYWTGDFCSRQSPCGTGQGVKTRGTRHANTVCEACADGFFSASSSASDTCVKHKDCASSGEIEILPGSSTQDTMCATYNDLSNGGEALRTFLSRFLALHRIRVVKLKTFIARYIQKAGERHHNHSTVSRQRGHLLEQIRAWLPLVPVEQLRRFPQMLRDSQLNSLADKLCESLGEIEQQASSNSSILSCTQND